MWRLVFVSSSCPDRCSRLPAAAVATSQSPTAGTSSPRQLPPRRSPSSDDKDLRVARSGAARGRRRVPEGHLRRRRRQDLRLLRGRLQEEVPARRLRRRAGHRQGVPRRPRRRGHRGRRSRASATRTARRSSTVTATINGDTRRTTATTEFPDYWVREDGEWKITTDDPKPCDTDGALGSSSRRQDAAQPAPARRARKPSRSARQSRRATPRSRCSASISMRRPSSRGRRRSRRRRRQATLRAGPRAREGHRLGRGNRSISASATSR